MIILYKCQGCHAVFDEVLVRAGWRCTCSGMFYSQVVPTKLNICHYILRHPLHAIKRILSQESDHE